MSLVLLKNLFPTKIINEVNEKLYKCEDQLFKDFENISYSNFVELIQKESIAARILGYRFADSCSLNILIQSISKWLSENKTSGKYYFSPLIMTRICKPGVQIFKNNAMLFTEPHYDKIENQYPFFGIWIPLEPVNEETGGLCWFDMPENIRLENFPLSGKNLSLKQYSANYETIDPIVKPYLKTLDLLPGDVIIFDENCLHGATKPRNRPRRSINFQMIHESIVDKLTEIEKQKIMAANSYLDICNLINLFYLGDVKFAEKNIKKYSLDDISNNKIKHAVKNIYSFIGDNSGFEFETLKKVIPWHQEYKWLN